MNDERISAYLLGELGPSDRERFESDMAADAGLAAEVQRLAPVVDRLAGLDESAWLATTPPDLAPHVLPGERRRKPLVLQPPAAVMAAVVLLVVGIAAGLVLGGNDRRTPTPSDAKAVALDPVTGSGQRARGRARLDGNRLIVNVEGLKPTGERRFYEVWLLNSTDDLVALGAFRVPATGDATVALPVPVRASDFRFVDVSLEPEDGDPSHSGTSVLRAGVPRS